MKNLIVIIALVATVALSGCAGMGAKQKTVNELISDCFNRSVDRKNMPSHEAQLTIEQICTTKIWALKNARDAEIRWLMGMH